MQNKVDDKPPAKSTTMHDDGLTNKSLEALQDEEQRKIMDVVDRLRRTGLSSILQLPQLVVCGDQSSGKSSVLEAITEIPFPRKENLCTRFATEIVLRRDPNVSITTKITPDKSRPQAEQDKLKAFSKSIEDFQDLPSLIEEATTLMGLDDVNGNTIQDETTARAFSRDVLSIEICGPKRPQLTLVDLPGLIHAASKAQSKHDVELIHSLVEEYISNERTLILAVISAKNDYANQMILDKARKVDPDGNRTLGVITKPDTLRAGSENEATWIRLAQNEDIFFKLGWHMLRNRVDGDLSASFKERNESEAAFFSQGSYAELDRAVVGIEAFRTRLSETLTEHLKRELPSLRKELKEKLDDTQRQVTKLGNSRATISEQKQYLVKVSQAAEDIFKAAVGGTYSNPFFGRIATDKRIDEGDNVKRLRAVVQHLNIQFERDMRLKGRKFFITNTDDDDSDDDDSDGEHMEVGGQTHLTREAAENWVVDILTRTRGCELPGNCNSMLISELFWEQSSGWEALAWGHVQAVADLCKVFVGKVLDAVATQDVVDHLQAAHLEAALQKTLVNARSELSRFVSDKDGVLMTYNHYYTTTIQKKRQASARKGMQTAINETLGVSTNGDNYNVTTQSLLVNSDSLIELNMDKFMAREALDHLAAFYKAELKVFIHNIVKHVIERHLIKPFQSEEIMSPVIIAKLSDEEVSHVAAEPSDISSRRKNLLAKERLLLDGQDTFRRAMGGR